MLSAVDRGLMMRNWRLKKKFSTADMARKLGISKTYIYDIEKGEKTPSVDIVIRWVNITRPSMKDFTKMLYPSKYTK